MYKHLIYPSTFQDNFLVHKLEPGDLDYSLFTGAELKKLNRVFGHPSVYTFINFLKRARPDEMNKEVRDTTDELMRACVTCATIAPSTRLKVAIGTDELKFNHIVAIDVMYINNRSILPAVDEATHYRSTLFLNFVRAFDAWKTFLRCWSRLYLGPPDFLRVDQDSNLVSKEMLDSAETDDISVL